MSKPGREAMLDRESVDLTMRCQCAQGRAGPGRFGGDEADRRTLPGDAVLWIAQDGGGVARGGTRDQPQEGSPADAPVQRLFESVATGAPSSAAAPAAPHLARWRRDSRPCGSAASLAMVAKTTRGNFAMRSLQPVEWNFVIAVALLAVLAIAVVLMLPDFTGR
jgi:hypothetical protein